MMDKKEKILAEAREIFDRAAEAESENRAEALDDIRFARLGEQWPDDVKNQRKREQRPCLTINRLPSFIRQVVNDYRQNKPSIKCHPADSVADVGTADVINGLIRNIEYTSNADVAYDTAIENSVTCGVGYWRIALKYAHDDSFDLDLCIERVANVFSVYGDPHSEAADSSDWKSAFIVDMMRKCDFEKKYKNAEAVDWDGSAYSSLPTPWVEEDQVMIAEYWKREEVDRPIVLLSDGTVLDVERYKQAQDVFSVSGIQVVEERTSKSWKVTQYILTGAEVLEENEWAGKYIPIVPVYGDEVNIEGKRYFRSLIRDAKDPQRMFNYWRTTSTEMVALAPKTPFIGAKGSFKTDIDKWNTSNTQSHAFIEYDGVVPPQRQGYAGPAAGAIQEAMNASDDIKSTMGIYDAALGARSNETSGRAILARQRESDVSTFHFMDNLARAIRHTGRILIDLIPTVYTGKRVIRVLGQGGGESKAIPLGVPTQTENGVIKIYDLAVGKYDLTVETGASFTTRREEAATQMLELLRVYPNAAPVIGDLLVKNLDWPGADEIAKRLFALLPPKITEENQQQNPQVVQMQQVIQQLQGQVNLMTQQLQEAQKDKMIDVEKVKIDAYNAETNRIKATQAGMNSEQIQALIMQTLENVLSSPDILPNNMIPPNIQSVPQNPAANGQQNQMPFQAYPQTPMPPIPPQMGAQQSIGAQAGQPANKIG